MGRMAFCHGAFCFANGAFLHRPWGSRNNLWRQQTFPTEGISVSSGGNFRFVGNFANCGTCKAYKSVSRKVRQVRKVILNTELRGLCGLGVRAIREFCQLTQEVLSTDTRSCVNRQKSECQPANPHAIHAPDTCAASAANRHCREIKIRKLRFQKRTLKRNLTQENTAYKCT